MKSPKAKLIKIETDFKNLSYISKKNNILWFSSFIRSILYNFVFLRDIVSGKSVHDGKKVMQLGKESYCLIATVDPRFKNKSNIILHTAFSLIDLTDRQKL
jgi:hypothetical protein